MELNAVAVGVCYDGCWLTVGLCVEVVGDVYMFICLYVGWSAVGIFVGSLWVYRRVRY